MSALAESFVFGLANCLHCAGMCGPLAACTAGGGRLGAGAYHGARVGSYVLAGALAGAAGGAAGAQALGAPPAWVSFVLAGSLVLFGFGLLHRLGSVPGLAPMVRRVAGWSRRLPPAPRAAALGALTPLLPCGLLWAALAGALLAGGALAGATVMLGFALGTLPALAGAQAPLRWLGARLSPAAMRHVQRSVLLLAAAVLVWRGWTHLGGASCCG